MRNLTFRIAAVGLILGMSSASVPAMAESPEFEECVANCIEYADGNQTPSSETTAKGTGLELSAGKEDPVELDSSPTL